MSFGKPVALFDFSGGYNTRTPYELMKAGELLVAENCQWRDGLIQRGGHRIHAVGWAAGDVVYGVSPRFYTNAAWYTIIAVDEAIGGDVRFWSLTGTTLARLSTTVTFTPGYDVIFAEMGGKVVAVNGHDDAVVIYYDGGWVLETLDEHDIRTRDEIYWSAGQYDDSVTTYTDDTTDAQDADAADFQLGSADANDGFFVACDHTFNKIVITAATQAGGAPVASYQYFGDDEAWHNCTMVQTPTWTAVAGTRTIEFDYPSDMGRWTGDEAFMVNRFVFRLRFTTAPTAAFTCTSMAVYHSQWITQMTEDTKPHYVATHGSRMWLAVGYIMFFSPPNDIVGWRGPSEAEYFLEGGPYVRSALSFQGYLVVLKDNAFYVFYGTDIDTFSRKKLFDVGVKAVLTPVSTEDGEMMFLSQDGIRAFNGTRCIPVSGHILDDMRDWTWESAVAVAYDGEYWISFPKEGEQANRNDIVLTIDPSTITVNEDTGDGWGAFYKFTDAPVDYWINCSGKDDTGYLLAVVGAYTPYVARLDNGTTDEFTDGVYTAIDFQAKPILARSINHLSYGVFVAKFPKTTTRTKYDLTFYADEDKRNKSCTIVVPAGSGYYEKRWTRLPSILDGKNLSLLIRNNQDTDAGLRGISFEYQKKRF